jgi:hypothetical protein
MEGEPCPPCGVRCKTSSANNRVFCRERTEIKEKTPSSSAVMEKVILIKEAASPKDASPTLPTKKKKTQHD